MEVQNYNVIGVMSGTSLDGIDIAHLAFNKTASGWHFNILTCETIAYTPAWFDALRDAVHLSDEAVGKLDVEYTMLLGKAIKKFMQRHDIKEPDAVCSHGHTIRHNPAQGVTIQIGNRPELAEMINCKVVCDFRVQDVLLGGQGAPLVPIGDRMLFPEYDYCVNLGGFSNISFEFGETRMAFDVSPLNTVLNHYAMQLGLKYDDKGSIARSGAMNSKLLEALNALPFYTAPYPKSLGIEFVHQQILPLMDRDSLPVADLLQTFTYHAALQLAAALPERSGRMLLTGGGAYNDYFIECLAGLLPDVNLSVPAADVLEYKEALIFGLLGVLRLENQVNVLSSVTGALHDHCSGKIFIPGAGVNNP